jgi:hypothetical protein
MINTYLKVVGLVMFTVLGCYSHTTSAQCSADDIRSYMEGGATADQLSQLCGQQQGSGSNYGYPVYPAVPAARLCVTAYGACVMTTYTSVGSYCECFGTYGRLPGIAR